jgi:hypothetical protein
MKEHYIVTESWVQGVNDGKFMVPLLIKNTGIVVIYRKKNKVRFNHQGRGVSIMDSDIFDSIPKIATTFTDEFINDYIIAGENIKTLKKIISDLKKEFKGNKLLTDLIKTLEVWILSTKGSKAIKGKQYNDLNFENLPWAKSNLKTKPYDWNLNRCGRTMSTPSDSDISEWSKNPKNVLPIGIKKNEQCSYTEMYKIGVKLLQQVCGIQGVPLKFKEIIKEKINSINLDYELYDYMDNERITLDMYLLNTHHGKEKGIELCHKNPKIEFATSCENVTIGKSESNRSQSGNSFIDMAVKGVNCLRIDNGQKPLTPENVKVFLKLILTIDKFTL